MGMDTVVTIRSGIVAWGGESSIEVADSEMRDERSIVDIEGVVWEGIIIEGVEGSPLKWNIYDIIPDIYNVYLDGLIGLVGVDSADGVEGVPTG